MLRQIIKIDKDMCNGCGLCVTACNEGAIGLLNGKAELLHDDYCDGLGNCLPVCPRAAITFERREAMEYNEDEVKMNRNKRKEILAKNDKPPWGCLGANLNKIKCEITETQVVQPTLEITSRLNQWPVKIKLAHVNAPYFHNANLLVSADCTAYAYGNFHNEFMRNKITLIGCSKLDNGDYSEKLTVILRLNNIKSITVVRMEVPCCGGIESAILTALSNSGKKIPWQVITISKDGHVIS